MIMFGVHVHLLSMGKGREVSVGKACKETSIALEGHFFFVKSVISTLSQEIWHAIQDPHWLIS